MLPGAGVWGAGICFKLIQVLGRIHFPVGHRTEVPFPRAVSWGLSLASRGLLPVTPAPQPSTHVGPSCTSNLSDFPLCQISLLTANCSLLLRAPENGLDLLRQSRIISHLKVPSPWEVTFSQVLASRHAHFWPSVQHPLSHHVLTCTERGPCFIGLGNTCLCSILYKPAYIYT